jgi:serine/threonine protein kinase
MLCQLQQYDFVVKMIDCFKPEMEGWDTSRLAIVFEKLEPLPHPSTLSVTDIINISKQLLFALYVLHEKQSIVHMDIKPSNLMMKKTTNQKNIDLKIIDFELATPYCQSINITIGGTKGFFAPELLGKKKKIAIQSNPIKSN